MKAIKSLAVCAALFLSTAHAAVNGGITVSHFEPLQRLSIEKAGAPDQQKILGDEQLALQFDAFGRTFDLRLEPNDRLLPAVSQLNSNVAVFRGNVVGDPDSWVRIVVADDVPRGLIRDGGEMFAVEAAGDAAVQSPSPVIYRLADTYVAPGTMSCGVSTSGSGAQMYGDLVGELNKAMAKAPGATTRIDIGAIGDFEFFDDKGGNSEAAILTRLNNVDGIYSEQLGVQIHVEELEVFTNEADAFGDVTDAEDLLDELAAYRFATPAQKDQGLTHLYTGRDLDSNTVGIAFQNALCHRRFGAGLTQGSNSATFDSLVAAHEIGHNFGAPHDAEAGSACKAETSEFIMAQSLNGSDRFSQCSIEQMQPKIAAASCIVALPTVDMSVEPDEPSQVLFLGNSATLTFTVANVGTEAATNVGVEIEVPAIVSLDSITTSQGSCTSGAGTVACDIGTVQGGSSPTVSLSVTAMDSGNGEFVASVSADADDNPGNNEATVQLTVDPAVDLAVSVFANPDVNLNENVPIGVTLENRSVLNATGVELSITFGNGLQAEEASWSLGKCTVTVQQVDCEAVDFSAQSVVPLELNVTATTVGTWNYQISLSSSEADANPADNNVSGSVTVSAPAMPETGASGGGGGGATGLLSLLLLGSAALRRRPGYDAGAAFSVLTTATSLGLIPRSLIGTPQEPLRGRVR